MEVTHFVVLLVILLYKYFTLFSILVLCCGHKHTHSKDFSLSQLWEFKQCGYPLNPLQHKLLIRSKRLKLHQARQRANRLHLLNYRDILAVFLSCHSASEIKNVAGNQKKFKIALKKFLYTYSFYTFEDYLSQLWIKDYITKFEYSGIMI